MASINKSTGVRRAHVNAQSEKKRTMQHDITPKSCLLLTARGAAEALSISPRKLWSMTKSGEIPCVRLGRCVRYPADQLQRGIDLQVEGGVRRLLPNGYYSMGQYRRERQQLGQLG